MRRFFILILLMIYIPTDVFASVGIVALLPNPAGDDTLGEYIELRNTGCESVDISGYKLADASGKSYTIPTSQSLMSYENRKFPYSETKIALNNSGEEIVSLRNTGGTLVDEYRYSGTQRDDIVLTITHPDEDCTLPEVIVDTGALDTGTGTMSGTGDTTGSGGVDILISSGVLISGTGNLESTGGLMIDTGGLLTGNGDSLGSLSGETMTATGGVVGTGSHLESTGAIVPSVSENTETGVLSAIEMYYDDTDKNGKIDTLEILYPYVLTGRVYTGSIAIFSRSGGLSESKIDTATGYISDASLSGNVLILTLIEGDVKKTILKINNTTTSDLRIKSSGDLGFRSLGGQSPDDFLLTKSFDEYRKVRSRLSSLSEDSASGVTVSGALYSASSGDLPSAQHFSFPDIIPILQSPTNATLSGDTFLCTTSECRVNLTLEPIFSSGYSMQDYICSFGTGEMIVTDTDCNPNTLYFSSSGSLTIELAAKNNALIALRKTYPIIFQIAQNIPQSIATAGSPDTTKPIAILEIDGKWKEYYEQIDTYEMNCYTLTCSVNWTAENSYDPGGGTVRFFWIYGANKVGWSEDPGTQKYSLGDHEMILRVIDTSGNYDEIRYMVHVLGPKPKIEKIKSEKKPKILSQKIIPEKKKKIKKLKMVFFSAPSLDIQGNNTRETSSGMLQCLYKTKKICNLNLALADAIKGYSYSWILDGVEIHRGKNPKSWPLTPGRHTLTLHSYLSDSITPVDTQLYSIIVAPAPKAPKKLKTKPSPKKISDKKNIIDIIPVANANSETSHPISGPGGVAMMIFLSGLGLGYLLKRKKKYYL